MQDDPEVLAEIRSIFENIYDRSFSRIESLKDTEAYVLCQNEEFGVAIWLEDLPPVEEEFANVRYAVRDFTFNDTGVCRSFLTLTSRLTDVKFKDRFVIVCYDFLMWASSDENASSDPFVWWKDWKSMLGNKDSDDDVYPVIAEMIALDMMQSEGLNPVWEGPSSGTVDIRSKAFDCEVKSTLSRYKDEITISSEYQLRKTDRVLHLYYIVFERSESGFSVDDMVARLVSHGMDAAIIENNLKRHGIRPGNLSRTEKFAPLRICDYPVDENFPRMDDESFVDGHKPKGVVSYRYTVSLQGVHGKELEYPLK